MYANLNRKYNIRLENMRSATELWRRQKGAVGKGLSGEYGYYMDLLYWNITRERLENLSYGCL